MAAGAALFLLGVVGWNAWFFGWFGLEGPAGAIPRMAGLAVGVGSMVFSVSWTTRLISVSRQERTRRETEAALSRAHVAYLQGDLVTARGAVREGLRADPRDVDLLFLEWRLARDRGDPRTARRARRRLTRLDLDEKWLWDVEREEAVGGRG